MSGSEQPGERLPATILDETELYMFFLAEINHFLPATPGDSGGDSSL
jgi:hypothetical protein